MEQVARRQRAASPKRGWSATGLKLLAAALMLPDHVHQMFAAVGAPLWLTMLGRPVFPLFLFTAAESFHYTRSRCRYLMRLLVASWGMTLLTTGLQWLVPVENVVLMNNAFSTFFVAGLYCQSWDWLCEGIRTRKAGRIAKALLCGLIPIVCTLPLVGTALLSFREDVPATVIRTLALVSMLFPSLLTVEGGAVMVLLGVLFYMFRNHRWAQIAALLVLSAVVYCVNGGGIQWMMCLAALPMAWYSGAKGHGWKYFFYGFYPAHIAILYLLAALLQ